MHTLLSELRIDHLIDDDIQKVLSTKFSGLRLEILKNDFVNYEKKNLRKYSQEIMEFAMTLHFLSPKAYAFARKHLCLPSKSTLRRHQSVDGEPGWTSQSFAALKADSEKKNAFSSLMEYI